jgi:2-methylisocitrate lyase-like PEP mutase family enzyme
MPNVNLTPASPPEERRVALRTTIAAPGVSVLPGVFDGFSARLVEAAGYDSAFVTGAGVAQSRYGVPDVGIVGYAESLDGAATIAQRSGLALIADGDTGYGSPMNVVYTVRGFENAGLSGLLIEDQVWPKRCGHLSGKETIALREAAMKIRAAADARRDPNFVILARTDAVAVDGLPDAIARARAYAAEGARHAQLAHRARGRRRHLPAHAHRGCGHWHSEGARGLPRQSRRCHLPGPSRPAGLLRGPAGPDRAR